MIGDEAAFISAGGYHHHLGLNTWESRGGSPPPADTTGPLPRRDPLSRPRAARGTRLRLVEAKLADPVDGAYRPRRLQGDLPARSGRQRDRGSTATGPSESGRARADGGLAMISEPLDLQALLERGGLMPRGLRRKGQAAEEAERRLDELERGGGLDREPELRQAVYGSTEDEPGLHFIGWRDEVDPDELFASGQAWGSRSCALRCSRDQAESSSSSRSSSASPATPATACS